MTEQRQFTLAEARLELQRRECAHHGHDFDILQRAGEPFRLICPCGRTWSVTSDQEVPA